MRLIDFIKQGTEYYNELPDVLKKSVDFANQITNGNTNYDKYNNSEPVKKMIDLAIEKFENFLQSKKSVQKTTEVKTTRPAVSKKNSTQKKVTVKKVVKEKVVKPIASHHVEELSIDLQIIKRFVSIIGKEKTAKQIENLLDFVQKSIVTKRVRKTSEYANEINFIQKTLIETYKEMSKEGVVTLDYSNKAEKLKYESIVNDYAPIKSIALIKQYINLDGSKQTHDKAQRLWGKMRRFIELEENKHDKYLEVINQLKIQLFHYVQDKTDVLEINPVALGGILPVLARYGYKAIKYGGKTIHKGYQLAKPIAHHVASSVARHVIKTNHKEHLSGLNIDNDVMSVGDAKQSNFELIGFTGDFLKLIGKACEPTSIFIYGNGGSGKSGLSLKLADDLNKKNKSVMYVAGEQFNTPTFTELLRKVNITGSDTFKIVRSLNSLPIANYKVIVIDSKDSVGLTRSADFNELRNTYPDKIWIITSQGTKAGDFTGDEKWRNEVDTLIYCERGVAYTINEKNRWGGKAEIKLY